MSLTMESAYQILDFLKANENCALSIDAGDVKLSIAKGNMAAPAAAAPTAVPAAATAAPAPVATAPVAAATAVACPAAPAPAAATDADEAGLVPITANVTSVFYRAPSPSEPPFVEVGDEVQEDTCVCLLEVMKCFRQTMAGMKGRIDKICVDDAALVEAGTVMFLVKPL